MKYGLPYRGSAIHLTKMSPIRYDSPTMSRESENLVAPEAPAQAPEPPYLYIRACGALCDAFWWARRSTPARDSSDRERDESTPAVAPERS
ncbi:MAG: hypothetical protein WA740_12035 [Candidatus Binataceae bacterium]